MRTLKSCISFSFVIFWKFYMRGTVKTNVNQNQQLQVAKDFDCLISVCSGWGVNKAMLKAIAPKCENHESKPPLPNSRWIMSKNTKNIDKQNSSNIFKKRPMRIDKNLSASYRPAPTKSALMSKNTWNFLVVWEMLHNNLDVFQVIWRKQLAKGDLP